MGEGEGEGGRVTWGKSSAENEITGRNESEKERNRKLSN